MVDGGQYGVADGMAVWLGVFVRVVWVVVWMAQVVEVSSEGDTSIVG